MLVEWEVLGADGLPIPITVEDMVMVPTGILSKIMRAINEDSSGEAETRKNSDGGSFQRDK